MPSLLSNLALPQVWWSSIFILLAASIHLIFKWNASRPTVPANAPQLFKGWPLLGCIEFFRARRNFLRDGKMRSSNGQFSFYYGQHAIVALAGDSGRAFHFTARELDLSEGFNVLLAASPNISHLYDGDPKAHFAIRIKRLLDKDYLTAKLYRLTDDADATIRNIDPLAPVNIFDAMMVLVYQLSHRILGSNDIADDAKLLRETLNIFHRMDTSSGFQVMFPSLPTLSKLRKQLAGARLYWTFKKIMHQRITTGTRSEDAMQTMMDAGDSDITISAFIMGALFAGLVSTAVTAAWMLCYLAQDPYWYAKTQAEVDATVERHRVSHDESSVDVLQRIPMEAWDSEFPLLCFCLRETVRLSITVTSLRKNISGTDVPIGRTGQVIPKDAFAVYGIDDVHMDSNIYTNPTKWDPGRFLPGREEHKKTEYAYLGWGAGLHPCAGKKLATLEITISTAMFLAYYNFQLCDKNGAERTKPLPLADRNRHHPGSPDEEVYLKCTSRF